MTAFRNIPAHEWEIVKLWWGAAGMKFFRWTDLPQDTSFFATVDDVPVLACSLILTNSGMAWLEGFVGNPEAAGPARREATKAFLEFLEHVAKSHGARKILCMGPCPELTAYYESIGFRKTATVDTLIKEIK